MEKIGGERKIWLCPSHSFPIAASLSSAPARTTCQRLGKAQTGAGSRSSFPGTRRLDWGTRQPCRCAGAAWSARLCLGSEVTATIQDALVARLAGIPTWAEEMSLRGKDPRQSLLSLWIHLPPLPYPDSERDTHTKTFDTLLIYSRFLPLSQWATSCRTPE